MYMPPRYCELSIAQWAIFIPSKLLHNGDAQHFDRIIIIFFSWEFAIK